MQPLENRLWRPEIGSQDKGDVRENGFVYGKVEAREKWKQVIFSNKSKFEVINRKSKFLIRRFKQKILVRVFFKTTVYCCLSLTV